MENEMFFKFTHMRGYSAIKAYCKFQNSKPPSLKYELLFSTLLKHQDLKLGEW